jgi:prepilin-type N-terminal cleavage/methylation domain-containing protein
MAQVTGVRGFSLIEVLLVVALIATVGAMAIPLVLNTTNQIRLQANARQVERELQSARMKAVRSNRAIRVRFNCPTTGQYRTVELLGTTQTPAADDDDSRKSVRCSYSSYPYPDPDPEISAVPNNDGPIQTLPTAWASAATCRPWSSGPMAPRTSGRRHHPWAVIPTMRPSRCSTSSTAAPS